MLKIRFFNVAEGDAILLEYEHNRKPFRVLIDTGRRYLPESPGSLRQTASHHLQRLGIDCIDLLILTHFHVDHIQDLPEILKNVRIGAICSTYFPKDPGKRVPDFVSELKAVRELTKDLNTIAESIQITDRTGTEKILITADLPITPGDDFGKILVRAPSPETLDYQNRIYDRLFSGDPVSEEEIYRAARLRNINSLRVLAEYAGRRIALDGDYYACDAEKEWQQPCDILKAAHHGDRKSMTEKLAAMLKPKIAVISCMREYDASKDRPSRNTADLLRKYGAEVLYTDCFAEPGQPAEFHEEILVSIDEQGRIYLPDHTPGAD